MMNKKDGIKIEGHKGTWYVIDTKEVAGHELYLLEHEQYGDMADSLIVDYDGKIIAEDVCNGWEDLPNKFEIEVKIKGSLPPASMPGLYPIIYFTDQDAKLCHECATKEPEEIAVHHCYMEGASFECDNSCGNWIESAYGDPEEEDDFHDPLTTIERNIRHSHYED